MAESKIKKRRRYLVLWRDKICQICFGDVVWEDSNNSYLNTDHIIPKSKGGPDLIWNLRAAHVGCNSSRGNEIDPNAIRIIEFNLRSEFIGCSYPEGVREQILDIARRIIAGENVGFVGVVPLEKPYTEPRPCLRPKCQSKEWTINGKPWHWQLCEYHARQQFRGT